ncbi:hypothetical protein M408DRAFT_29078, partial [Serendipita vermifera MAFF 305830]
MDRADARRGARAERLNAAQSPYGTKQTRKKQPKVEKGGLWNFIKSWSFFSPDPDSNMAGDSDSDDDMPDEEPAKYYKKTPMKFLPPSNIKTSDDESGSSQAASASSVSSYDDDQRTFRVPGALRETPAYQPAPVTLRPARVAQIQNTTKKPVKSKQLIPQEKPRTTTPPAPQAIQTPDDRGVVGLVQRQVANFLLSKENPALTSKEYEQIRKVLKLTVDKDAVPSDPSLLQTDPVLQQAFDQAVRAEAEGVVDQQPEAPYMGTVITRVPQDEDDLLEEDINGSKHSSDSNQKVSDSGSDHYSSPSIATNGLPPFHPEDEEEDPSTAEPDPKQSELEEAERIRYIVDEKTEELRRYLHLDQDEAEEAQAWEELERWKGLKSPTLSAATSVSDTTSTSGTQKPEEATAATAAEEPTEEPEEPIDYNKGYSPAELMINPYERISAFRNRKTRRKLVSKEDLAVLRKKRAAAKEEAAKMEMARAELEREEAERVAAERRAQEEEEEAMAAPPIPQKQEIHMGILAGGIAKGPIINELPYDKEPVEAPPESGDWLSTGTTKKGKTWGRVVKKRKAEYLAIEANGVLYDPPTEGPNKRRRSTSPDDDQHLHTAMVISADVPSIEDDEDNDDDMIDETPEPPPPPPLVLTRPTPSRKKPRPKIRPVPDSTRPKHFQYSPITPSPLRMVSAFDSPKQASVEIPPEAVSPTEEAPLNDEESYAFSIYAYRLGSIGPMRTSRELIQRAADCSPYHLPEYTMGSGKYTARYGRGFKRRTPKVFRRARNTKSVDNIYQVTQALAARAAMQDEVQVIETPSLTPEFQTVTMNTEEEPQTTRGIPKL